MGIFSSLKQNMGGLFAPGDGGSQFMDRMNTPQAQIAMRLLQASQGASGKPAGSLGAIFGDSVMGYQNDAQQQQMQKLQMELMRVQTSKMNKPDAVDRGKLVAVAGADGKPTYQYEADAVGQTPWADPGASNTPSSLQEWSAFQKMTPAQQKEFLNMKRQPTMPQVIDFMGGKAWADRANQTISPVSNVTQEAAAQGTLAEGKAQGQARGEAAGAIEKKAIGAGNVMDIVNIAEPLIDVATGSKTGAAYDAVAGFFGGAPTGAKAIASLQVLEASLILAQPRMEGPQSNPDALRYEQAAAQIGKPGIPRDIKKSALNTIKELQSKYKAGSNRAAGSPATKEFMVDAQGNVVAH